jgi:hypothetical protein
MLIEIRTCPAGHVHKYPADVVQAGKVAAYYCTDCRREYEPREMRIERKEGNYQEAYS